jgi:hypothetical protein
VNTDGTLGKVTPFRIPATVIDARGKAVPLYPADIASVNHSHVAMVRKIALDANGVAQNSEYALTEEGVTLVGGKLSNVPTLERKQFGELVMSHVDCDTVPFLRAHWRRVRQRPAPPGATPDRRHRIQDALSPRPLVLEEAMPRLPPIPARSRDRW